MRTTKCDVCGRTEPDVNCRYSKRKKFGWFRHDNDSQGGSEMELDVCEQCWNGYKSFMQNRLSAKSQSIPK